MIKKNFIVVVVVVVVSVFDSGSVCEQFVAGCNLSTLFMMISKKLFVGVMSLRDN